MARQYFKVGPTFWTDHPWGDDERLAALYLLTSPHRTSEGIFRMPLQYASTDLGWPAKRFQKAFDQLVADGFVEYDPDASVCLIVNALKWQRPDNPNQRKAAVKAFEALPASPLLNRFRTLAGTLCPTLAEALPEGSAEPIPHPPTPTPTPTPAPNPSSPSELGRARAETELFAYWQQTCGHDSAKFTADRRAKVRARLREGYTPEQIRAAIDGAARAAFVNDQGKRFDDLELICRTGSKLEGFIGRATAVPSIPSGRRLNGPTAEDFLAAGGGTP